MGYFKFIWHYIPSNFQNFLQSADHADKNCFHFMRRHMCQNFKQSQNLGHYHKKFAPGTLYFLLLILLRLLSSRLIGSTCIIDSRCLARFTFNPLLRKDPKINLSPLRGALAKIASTTLSNSSSVSSLYLVTWNSSFLQIRMLRETPSNVAIFAHVKPIS